MHAFILAGGFATRLWPLTEKRAKPLLPLAGKPMISHIVEGLPADMPITVSTNEAFAASFEEWKETINRPDIEILIERSVSDDQKLGALGAVAQWVEHRGITDDVLLLAGDNYVGFAMSAFLKAYRAPHPLLAAFDIGSRERATQFGTVILGPDGRTVAAFEEKPSHPQTTIVSTGVSVIPGPLLPDLIAYAKVKPDNIGGIFEEFLRIGTTVDCFTFREPWFDVGSFDAYLEATRLLVGEQLLLENASFEESTREGSVVLGAGTIVRNSTLRNVVIFHHCTIDDCVLEDCIIDNECVLKGIDLTGKMIRSKTHLEKRHSQN